MYRDDLIRATMAVKLISGVELKRRTGLSHFTITRVRQGGNVSTENLKKIADALEISMGDLFDNEIEAASKAAA